MNKKIHIICYCIFGFVGISGIPYFYLNRFKEGFTIVLFQTGWFLGLAVLFTLDAILSESSMWYLRYLDLQAVIMYGMFYPIVIFIPAVIQATHMTYLILKKKI